MKKLFKEEKTVSVQEFILVNTILFTLLCLTKISAQIPINGFCRYREFSVKPNYTNISAVDYNSDGYKDLLIYNSTANKYETLTSDNKSNLIVSPEKSSVLAISDLHAMGNETTGKRFLMISRKNRQIAIASFSQNGSISIQNKSKLAGYPSKVDVGNIDRNGKVEGVVSGISLNGIHVFYEKNRLLTENVIDSKKSFSSVSFIDLNYDSYPDIAALDPLSNSIIFYYNNQLGDFTESRSIGLNGDVAEFKTADLNSDGFTDLVFIKNNRFEILLGDSVSSFHKSITVNTPVKPDKYAILDFNGDGYNDIAFINTSTGALYISFAQSTNSFYPPVLYMKKNNLVDLIGYIDRTGKKLAVLSGDGKVYLINSVGLGDDSFSISLGSKPGAIKTFDHLNDKFKDFCFVDEGERSLKLLLSERSSLFRTMFSIPLSDSYSNIVIDDSRSTEKTFYCYSKNERIIEIVRMHLGDKKYSKKIVYTAGPIEDFKLVSDRLQDNQTVYLLVNKEKKLLLQDLEFRNFRNISSEVDTIAFNVKNPSLSLSVYREIYYYICSDSKISLVKTVFDKKIIQQNILMTFELKIGNSAKYDLICFDENVGRFKPTAALVSIDKKPFLYYIRNNKIDKFSVKNSLSESPMLCYSVNESSDIPSFFYLDSKEKLRRLTWQGDNKPLAETGLFESKVTNNYIESKSVNNYYVTNINRGKTFLIYSDAIQNKLTFEKL